MQRTIVYALGLLMISMSGVWVATATHSDQHLDTLKEPYISGSAHAHAAGSHHAVGPTDCSGLTASGAGSTVGGACFDLSAHPAGSDMFLRAEDDHSPTEVSLFAGFDVDGDGCVGCAPGEDAAWTGTGSLAAELVDPEEPLVVFVRAASLEDGGVHAGTTGTLTLDVLQDDTLGCLEGDGHTGDECGEPFKSDLPYPYPCVPDCGR